MQKNTSLNIWDEAPAGGGIDRSEATPTDFGWPAQRHD